jgi:hypothetical protein
MRRTQVARSLGAGLIGLLVGMLILTPATAHLTQNTRHLGRHVWAEVVKQKVYTKRQSDHRFQRACRAGSVLAEARVAADEDFSAAFTTEGVQGSSCLSDAVEARRDGTGLYLVRFGSHRSDPATSCPHIRATATVQGTGQAGVFTASAASTECYLRVSTFDSIGAASDRPFFVMVGFAPTG